MGNTSNRTKVAALFNDRSGADTGYQAVLDRGYSHDRITTAMTDEARQRHYPEGNVGSMEEGNKAAEGAGVGGAIGSITGGLVGAIAAIGTTLILPGLGLVVAGPLAAGLAGAGAGGLTGGLVGALVGWGIPEEHIKHYEAGLHEGGIILGVDSASEAEARAIEDDWKAAGASRIDRY
ncbi:hypothetical protein [Tautonia plasticadhaerens]|uniref:General stress protein 17M-like domain-containing protein n=1 Tax=Tautonia plasticadhaerens TaxID=2527974 RepID=A0A518GY30_9BACT|nr:hypothetical protein [Tautonia plasticadhaerens]QDV33497.1 hypothetical protein ElP_13700 [Tautonia plasticadhaerens]